MKLKPSAKKYNLKLKLEKKNNDHWTFDHIIIKYKIQIALSNSKLIIVTCWWEIIKPQTLLERGIDRVNYIMMCDVWVVEKNSSEF
jgi:hypothetical protein